LRHHQLNRNILEAGKWQARLSDGKRKDVEQLHDRFPHLTEAFDSLLPIVGLWATVEIGTLHRILTIRCPEVGTAHSSHTIIPPHIHQEMVHYLRHIKRIWRQILPNEQLSFVDPASVTFLETLAPRFSVQDSAAVRRAMHDQILFPQINGEIARGRILNRILNIPERIPSLFTFFEDTKFLEPCAKALKCLFPVIPPRSTSSLRETFSRHLPVRRSPRMPVQQSEQVYASLHVARAQVGGWLAYRQMWLFAMRHFPHLTDTQEGKRSCIRFQLADLAHRLGYDSDQIHALRDEDPDRNMARKFLTQIRPTELYDFSDEDRAGLVEHICEEVRRRSSVLRTQMLPTYTTDAEGQPKLHRCGRPFERNHQSNQPFLFVGNIYGQIEMQRREHLTSFAFSRDIFIAFFGNDEHNIFSDTTKPPDDAPVSPVRRRSPSPTEDSTSDSETQRPQEPLPSMVSGFDLMRLTKGACKIPTSIKASNVIQTHLKAINSTSQDRIILYLWSQREFILYDSASEFSFYSKVKDLANKHFWFAVVKTPQKIRYVSKSNAWYHAKKYKVVFAGPKRNGGDSSNLPYTGDDLGHFLDYIDQN
jgi:hypothetical protein